MLYAFFRCHSILKVLRSPAIKTSISFSFSLIYLTTELLSFLRILGNIRENCCCGERAQYRKSELKSEPCCSCVTSPSHSFPICEMGDTTNPHRVVVSVEGEQVFDKYLVSTVQIPDCCNWLNLENNKFLIYLIR